MDRQQEFVLRTIEERDIRFVRLWFTDVLGTLKSVAIAPAELEGAFAEGIGFDGSVIEGFARVYEADMLAKPDPGTFQVLPWRGETPRHGPDVLRPHPARRHPELRRPAARAAAGPAARPPTRASPSTPTPRSSSSCSSRAGRHGQRPEPVDHAGYFDHVPHGNSHDFRRAAITMLETMGISVEFSHHEGAPGQNEIDLRYADALSHRRQHHDLPDRRQGGRPRAGHLRDVHAQAVRRAPRVGHAHPPLALRGRLQRVLRARRALPAVKTGRQFIAGLLRHGAEITRRHQPVGQLLQAALGRGRGAGPPHLGPQQPLRASCGCRCTSRTRAQSAASRSAASTARATPTSPSRSCWPPASRASRRATSCRRRPRTTSGASPTPSARRWASSRCPPASDEAIAIMEGSELVAETLGEHIFDFFLRNKRAEWDDYRNQVTPFELERYLPRL